MIRKGIGARVEGREIGLSLLTLVNRFKARSLGDLDDKLGDHRWKECSRLRSRGMESKATALDDKIDSLRAVMESVKDIGELRPRITSLFGDTEPGQTPRVITLSTVHKAKGREWDRIYLLGREQLMPSRYAKQEWELRQERNLIYVAVTRAKKELVEVEYVD
jgi:DNA helicase-2/ATP-dependent DNA helicase PcrA